MRTRALKQRINDLRRERLVFNDLLRKLATSLQTSRTNVVQALKSVHHANLARDRVRLQCGLHPCLPVDGKATALLNAFTSCTCYKARSGRAIERSAHE